MLVMRLEAARPTVVPGFNYTRPGPRDTSAYQNSEQSINPRISYILAGPDLTGGRPGAQFT